MAIWLGILLMLVPFFVIMVLESRRVDHDEEDEVGFSWFDENPGEEEYLGEEEEESGDNEGTKTKPDQTPLWKYVSRPEVEKGGGTTKFTCLHCKNTYTQVHTLVPKGTSVGKGQWTTWLA